MDFTESYAEQWLEDQGYGDIQYIDKTHEQPPDFVIDNRIAVEVRRLNFMTGDDNQGLESIEISLAGNIWDAIGNVEAPPKNCKVYMSCDYLFSTHPPKDVVMREVEHAMNQHVATIRNIYQHSEHVPFQRHELDCGLIIRFITTQKETDGCFELMGVHAGIAGGGQVITDSIDNINRCIKEKSDKIKNKYNLYEKWWLVLVEHNVYTTALQEPDELQAVKNALVDTAPWSRITILSGLDGTSDVELI